MSLKHHETMKDLAQLLLSIKAMVACGLSFARSETLDSIWGSTQEASQGLKVWHIDQAIHVTLMPFVQEQMSQVHNQLFQTSYQKNKDKFSNTFNLNLQLQTNISTSSISLQSGRRDQKVFAPQLLLIIVTLLHYPFPFVNHWSIEDDSVAGFWMCH